MIDLSTLAGLLEHRHRLEAYCPLCDRWAKLPLEKANYPRWYLPVPVARS